MRKKKRAQIVWEALIPTIAAIGTLLLAVVLYLIFSGKGRNALEFIKKALSFG